VLDAENRDTLFGKIEKMEGVVSLERNGHAVVELDDLARVPDLIATLARSKVRLTRVEPRTPTLEELYFAVQRGSRQ
jgi:hypothetical protein